jgi:hypothetical protein
MLLVFHLGRWTHATVMRRLTHLVDNFDREWETHWATKARDTTILPPSSHTPWNSWTIAVQRVIEVIVRPHVMFATALLLSSTQARTTTRPTNAPSASGTATTPRGPPTPASAASVTRPTKRMRRSPHTRRRQPQNDPPDSTAERSHLSNIALHQLPPSVIWSTRTPRAQGQSTSCPLHGPPLVPHHLHPTLPLLRGRSSCPSFVNSWHAKPSLRPS